MASQSQFILYHEGSVFRNLRELIQLQPLLRYKWRILPVFDVFDSYSAMAEI